jgi:hypothetical protein
MTQSVEIYRRLLPLARDYMESDPSLQQQRDYYEKKLLPLQMLAAASQGNVPMMEFLSQSGVLMRSRWPSMDSRPGTGGYYRLKYRNPLYEAASQGHINALVWLLDRGWAPDVKCLEYAVSYGSPEVVRLLLDNTDATLSLANPLLIAVEKENEKVTRMLLSAESMQLDDEAKIQALRRAKEMGLDSMARMLM